MGAMMISKGTKQLTYGYDYNAVMKINAAFQAVFTV